MTGPQVNPDTQNTELRVVIYSTDTWPHCRHAKEYLSKKSIIFTEYNVAKDRDALKEMVKKSGGQMVVPIILINDQVIVGFNQMEVERILQDAAKKQ